MNLENKKKIFEMFFVTSLIISNMIVFSIFFLSNLFLLR